MKILVVDDSRTMRKVIRGALEEAGHASDDIVEAGNGLEAIAELEKPGADFDLVLADWNMPEMDGLALLKNMKTTPELRSIAVIMVTSESERAKVVEAISAGANSYIAKPFTADTLARKVLQGGVK